MTVKEKLIYFVNHGMAIKYIAERMGVDPTTLSKWIREEKGITHKNENKLDETLLTISQELTKIME